MCRYALAEVLDIVAPLGLASQSITTETVIHTLALGRDLSGESDEWCRRVGSTPTWLSSSVGAMEIT